MSSPNGKNLLTNRLGLFASILFIGACFWIGFLWVGHNNQPDVPAKPSPAAADPSPSQVGGGEDSPIPETLPQKIPKEYNPGDTLLDLKLERDRAKSRDIETIKELLEKVGLTDKVRQEAEQELWRLTAAASTEHELEGLLKAKGYRDCLVTIGRESVTVVMGQKIRTEDARSIGELVTEGAGLRMDQIRIVEREKSDN